MRYAVKYSLWNVDADNAEEAKKIAVSILTKSAEHLVSVEIPKPKKSLLRMFFTGC